MSNSKKNIEREKNWYVLFFTSLQHVISLSISFVCPFCASSISFLSCRIYIRSRRWKINKNRNGLTRREVERESHGNAKRKKLRTSSSCLFALFFSPSASCFCSAARALESRTSSSLDRIIHSKCRSRSSYWRKTSFRRTRILLKKFCHESHKRFFF